MQVRVRGFRAGCGVFCLLLGACFTAGGKTSTQSGAGELLLLSELPSFLVPAPDVRSLADGGAFVLYERRAGDEPRLILSESFKAVPQNRQPNATVIWISVVDEPQRVVYGADLRCGDLLVQVTAAWDVHAPGTLRDSRLDDIARRLNNACAEHGVAAR